MSDYHISLALYPGSSPFVERGNEPEDKAISLIHKGSNIYNTGLTFSEMYWSRVTLSALLSKIPVICVKIDVGVAVYAKCME